MNEVIEELPSYYQLFICIIIFSFFFICITINEIFADSPSFPEQEINDNFSDWINMDTWKIVEEFIPQKYTDITSVDYYSDGKFLNATLWLYFPFQKIPPMKEVNYGMLIDADFNNNTGYNGIDYKVELQWKNKTNSWNKVIETWSRHGETRTIANYHNYKNFFEENKKYITLSLDLKKILYPQKYKVVFYAEFKTNDRISISDFTRWIAIPPLELNISTIPRSIEIFQGIPDNILIQINSTEGYAPQINLTLENRLRETFFDYNSDEINLPSYGMTTIPIKITPTKHEMIGPQPLDIIVKSNFPPDEIIKIHGIHPISSENIIKKSTILLTIKPEPDFFDKIQMSWGKVGDFAQFLYGIIAGLSPFVYQQIRKFTNNQASETNNNS